jgi:hypothetical protein
MDKVYILWHTHPSDSGEDNAKLISVYASEDDALSAKLRVQDKSGFCSFPEGFEIHDYKLGVVSREEGFFSSEGSLAECPPSGSFAS